MGSGRKKDRWKPAQILKRRAMLPASWFTKKRTRDRQRKYREALRLLSKREQRTIRSVYG